MAFTTPTNSFKKPPSCLWFCHSSPRSTTSMVTSSSSSCSFSKPLYRWQVQIPHSKKDRFHNIAMVFSPFVFNTRSKFTTMCFDESQRFPNTPRHQSCVDFRLIVESRRGNSYARMVPRGNHKDGPHGNTYINTLRKKQEFQKPQTWNQATQALRNVKEDAIFSNKVSVSVPNVQYAESLITQDESQHETQNIDRYEKFPSQSQPTNQQPNRNFPSPKHFESKQKTTQDTRVNGVQRKDLPSRVYLMDKSQLPSQSQQPNGNFPSPKHFESKQMIVKDARVNGVHRSNGNFPSQSQQPNRNSPSTKLFELNQKIAQEHKRVNGVQQKNLQPKNNFVNNRNFSSPKRFEPKQKIIEETSVNGAHQKDLQLKNQLVDYDDDFNETYIVPIDSIDSGHLQNRLKSIYEKVLVVDNISVAQEVVKKLTNEYRHLVHACDTEVAAIDVKQETPVDHGKIICFSIYSGHEADFGNGKSCIWVDVLDGGGKNILDIFKPFFEDPFIKKVWHNYSFDNHIIENYGLKLSGFHADTMHMARLWDSSRQMSGGYSLEALTSDTKGIMSGANLGPNEELIGKVSMKTIFGRKKLKKDGTEGKVVIIPPVEELQKEEREPWVCYSALDSISTLKLYERLKSKLSNREWKFDGITKGNLFDFYEQYWRPFGELLVKMETEGMLVDRAHLFEKEIEAKEHQKIAADRFRNWASKLCPDAKFMNVGSDTQLRTLFFGGIENSKDPSQTLPTEKEFKVPNVDNIIEEGKKTATKFRKIKLNTISPGPLPTETYTASGWPSVSGAVLRTLAGKLSKYDDNLNVMVNENDDEEVDDVDDDDVDDDVDDGVEGAELAETKKENFVGNSEDIYGTAYDAFGGGYEGHEACHAINALCDVCTIDSLISNFILPLQGSHISGNDGRIHCSLNINTETGRLSARRPNLQNQPALEKDIYKIRKAFIAAPGNSLIVADYGQLELRILAHLADCKSMLDAFKAGGDFHSRTAMNMYPEIREAIDNKEVLLEWDPQPGEEKPPVPLLKDKFASHRRKAKMLNFSIAYGKTAVGLARDWKVSVKEARETVNRWYSDRKEVLKWQQKRKQEAREIGCVYTLLGRARTFSYPHNAPPSHKGHIERAAINTPVQGSAADVAMCAMLEISKNARLKELGWKLLLQVHDEVILEGPTESAEVAKAIVVDCMSKPFDGENILKVGLSVDAKFAQSWYDAK